MKRYALAVGFVLVVWLGSRYIQTTREIQVYGGLGCETQAILDEADLDYAFEGRTMILRYQDPAQMERALLDALRLAQLLQDVSANNVANATTSHTADGTPYRRQVVLVDAHGRIGSVVEDGSDFNWVYDPGHPDCMKEGSHAGYVAMPNVNVGEERAIVERAAREEKTLRLVLERLNPSLVLGYSAYVGKMEPHSSGTSTKFESLLSGGASQSEKILEEGRPFEETWLVPQRNEVACGQASVAMALNWISGRAQWTDSQVHARYGFQLLEALKTESHVHGVDWLDAGNLTADNVPKIEKVLAAGYPVIVALNGEFAADDRGNIVLLTGCDGGGVCYVDPQDGEIKWAEWGKMLTAPSHPDGNFVFLPCALDASDLPETL